MKADELRALDPEDLEAKIIDLKKEQFNLRFQRASGQLENTARVKQVRRSIARAKTLLRQKVTGKAGAAE